MGAQRKNRIVLDTNVLISAFLWQGTTAEMFHLAKDKRIIICANKEILKEFERVLSYPKFQEQLSQIEKTPDEIIDEFTEIIEYRPVYKFVTPQITADPSDDMFLMCAFEAEALCIVSGDRHLLDLKKFHSIPILTPRQFLAKLKR
jgi:uncharacterized protein